MNPANLLNEFIETFDAPRDPALWTKLVREEVEELKEAAFNLIKEYADVAYTLAGLEASGVSREESLKLTFDVLPHMALVTGLLGDSGEIAEVAFRLVHESNMSKVGDDGKPIRREDGKVLKGPNYQPPDLTKLLELVR